MSIGRQDFEEARERLKERERVRTELAEQDLEDQATISQFQAQQADIRPNERLADRIARLAEKKGCVIDPKDGSGYLPRF